MRTLVDRQGSVAAFGAWQYPILKHADDLARYRHTIAATGPTMVVETGTRTGASALFFAAQPGIIRVITIDIDNPHTTDTNPLWRTVHQITGSSTTPAVIAEVTALAAGHRVTVSLDSDHSAGHVGQEIRAYAPLVAAGCHLVVEDGIIAWLDTDTRTRHGCDIYTGTVLQAIDATLLAHPDFERDTAVETLTPVTMFPAGWWRRR